MAAKTPIGVMTRRVIVKSGFALAAAGVSAPFVITARAADSVKIGLDNPLDGHLRRERQERAHRLPAGA